MKPPFLAITIVLLLSVCMRAQTTVVVNSPLSPIATFLRTDPGDTTTPPVIHDLAMIGILPGDLLIMTAQGDFQPAANLPDDQTFVRGVFSSSSVLLGTSVQQRVPDAIAAGVPSPPSPLTFYAGLATDIPEDFVAWSDPNGIFTNPVLVSVPAGATHLFVGCADSGYFNNSDPDMDYGYKIELYIGSLGNGQAPQAGLAVLDMNAAMTPAGFPVTHGLLGPYFATVIVGGTVTIDFGGETNQPIYFLAGPLNPGVADYTMFGSGQLDIGTPDMDGDGVPESLYLLGNGFTPATFFDLAFYTGPSGQVSMSIPFGAPLSPGTSLGGFQAVMASAGGLKISNAVSLTVN